MDLDIRGLARIGALARLEELRVEEKSILKFLASKGIHLTSDHKPRRKNGHANGRPTIEAGVKVEAAPTETATAADTPRRRRKMTPAQKLEVSKRMKKYWAKRRRES